MFRRRRVTKDLLVGLVAFGVAVLWGSSALAVQGKCSNCHTMHNSQDGNVVTVDASGNSFTPTNGALGALLKKDCVTCHTGRNDGTSVTLANGTAPYVLDTVAPTMTPGVTGNNVLAGGNFYWVNQTGGDAYGHNVAGLASGRTQDAILQNGGPPGFGSGAAASDSSTPFGGTWTSTTQLTCAGTNGCHGTHSVGDPLGALQGAHHSNGGSNDTITAQGTPGEGFRFLVGIGGYEDADWEFTASSTDHNIYKAASGGTDNSTISSMCARCHGDFHSTAQVDGAWIRHPADFDMNSAFGTEYASYTTYNVEAPVGRNTISSTPSQTVDTSTAGNSYVTCVSCHRAHGSPYADLLRWDYNGDLTATAAMEAGSTTATGTGCFICHTSKDG